MPVASSVRLARVYTPAGPDDGYRVLVDGLWPRGLSKADAALDLWCRDIAPSRELRTWYGHDPERFEEFADRYRDELTRPPRAAALEDLRGRCRKGTVTLLTATRSVELSQAKVLADLLSGGRGGAR